MRQYERVCGTYLFILLTTTTTTTYDCLLRCEQEGFGLSYNNNKTSVKRVTSMTSMGRTTCSKQAEKSIASVKYIYINIYPFFPC